MSTPIIFNGSIPQNYEDYLTPFLFAPFANDLIERIDATLPLNILELACGTGVVTKLLAKQLTPGSHLTATDLQLDMLNIAKRSTNSSQVTWDIVDMTRIPYRDDNFDMIICQFGIMLVPDKLKALQEMHRVLKPGGKLMFSVWGNVEENAVWNISGQILNSYLGVNPIIQDPGPFAMNNENDTIRLMKTAGFENPLMHSVKKIGEVESAASAAKGFIEGLPVFVTLSQKKPELIPEILEKLEKELIKSIGDQPARSPLHALLFESIK